MNDVKDNGGPAYPTSLHEAVGGGHSTGMSLRDHFAAAALTGLLAAPMTDGFTLKELSRLAYDYADVMIEARKS